MSTNKKTIFAGTLTGAGTLTLDNASGIQNVFNVNTKADVILNVKTLSGGSATFTVEELFSDFWYATAQTPVLAASQEYGLPNANFPFLGKGSDMRFVATPSSTGVTSEADVYLVSYAH